MKVIICDDDPNQRDSFGVCFTVSRSRYDLTEFELGAAMLEYLSTSHADHVCLDLGLPDMDGLSTEATPEDIGRARDHRERQQLEGVGGQGLCGWG